MSRSEYANIGRIPDRSPVPLVFKAGWYQIKIDNPHIPKARLAKAYFPLRLSRLTALSFVNVKEHWLLVKKSVAVLQSSLLVSAHPDND